MCEEEYLGYETQNELLDISCKIYSYLCTFTECCWFSVHTYPKHHQFSTSLQDVAKHLVIF